jgi:hypothetical protein
MPSDATMQKRVAEMNGYEVREVMISSVARGVLRAGAILLLAYLVVDFILRHLEAATK